MGSNVCFSGFLQFGFQPRVNMTSTPGPVNPRYVLPGLQNNQGCFPPSHKKEKKERKKERLWMQIAVSTLPLFSQETNGNGVLLVSLKGVPDFETQAQNGVPKLGLPRPAPEPPARKRSRGPGAPWAPQKKPPWSILTPSHLPPLKEKPPFGPWKEISMLPPFETCCFLFRQNTGKPPFTSCNVQVYNVSIPALVSSCAGVP